MKPHHVLISAPDSLLQVLIHGHFLVVIYRICRVSPVGLCVASASDFPPGFLRKEPDELQVHRGSLNGFQRFHVDWARTIWLGSFL